MPHKLLDAFAERLAAAPLGEPSLFRVRPEDSTPGIVSGLKRTARRNGWLVVDLRACGSCERPPWARDRSVVLFLDDLCRSYGADLLRAWTSDVRPHVVVWLGAPAEARGEMRAGEATVGDHALDAPARARRAWRRILRETSRARAPQAVLLRERGVEESMTDDLVGVLQICQDVEDEHVALTRVGAYVRDRLRASTVAFVARERGAPYVVARVGPDARDLAPALRAIETGVAVADTASPGVAESAHPVRHASEVIGAVYCRWANRDAYAAESATPLLGLTAAATAPSLRVATERRQPSPPHTDMPGLVGDSPGMALIRAAIARAAASPFPVLIEGESGSGKELVARAIHALSHRRSRRMQSLNCAALVDDLVEAELFGHAKGAFTGAAYERPGLFEEAHGATLFLDEVAELRPRVQAKLLRTLQEGEVRRLGESNVRKVDVRIVAATNRPLADEVNAGRFRQDLWYRLDVIRIAVPPLRARLEDLPGLVRHFWSALAQRTGSRAVLSPAAVAALCSHDWPGNVRELQNVLASIVVSAPQRGVLGVNALPPSLVRVAALTTVTTLEDARRQFEVRYVRAALARAGGRTGHAARELGLTRQGLAKVLARLGIDHLPRQDDPMGHVE